MIKVVALRKKLLKEGAIALAVLAVAGGIAGWATMEQYSVADALEQLKQGSQRQISDAQAEQHAYEETLQAFSRYEQIPKNHLPSSDYDSIQSRIRELRPIVEELKDRLKFSLLDVKLSKIEPPAQLGGDQKYSLIRNEIQIQYQGLSDEYVYAFIQLLMERLPGYISVKNLNVVRAEAVTPDLLKKVSASGVATPLVTGNMTLVWKTIRKNAEANGQRNAP